MLQETMLYSAKTAVMGMLVVFTFLALLSVLMWTIKRVVTGVRSESSGVSDRSEPAGKTGGARGEEWVTVAATLYLLLEQDESRESAREKTARPWRPAVGAGAGLDSATRMWILSGEREER